MKQNSLVEPLSCSSVYELIGMILKTMNFHKLFVVLNCSPENLNGGHLSLNLMQSKWVFRNEMNLINVKINQYDYFTVCCNHDYQTLSMTRFSLFMTLIRLVM